MNTSTPRPGPLVALVPLRSPGEGKTRLSHALDPTERAALAGAMLADVTSALRGASVDRVVVAASGPAAAAAASALRVDVLIDPPTVRSLDDAIVAARRSLGAVAGLLVVTADLPRLTTADIDAVLARDEQVVVAPTDDGGTGALLRQPAGICATAYGTGSAEAHERLGLEACATVATLDLPGFRHDVDTWADVTGLVHGHVGDATAAFLDSLGARLDAAG